AVKTGREEHYRNPQASIVVMVAAAVDVLRVTVRVVLIVELERHLLRLVHLLNDVAELRGETARADELHVSLAAARDVLRRATAQHVYVELRHDRVGGHGEMIGHPA